MRLRAPHREAPVDPVSGTLAVGVPGPDTVVRIVDDAGEEVPFGEQGEIAVRGPQVVPGYWHRPEATAETFPGGELRTGDIGFMDERGWLYVVDRKKDMINASGFKVWPREVEDVLYTHPAVREAAVVGVPDGYRGDRPGVHQPPPRRGDRPRGTRRVLPGETGRLQVPEAGRNPARPAQDGEWEDSAPGTAFPNRCGNR